MDKILDFANNELHRSFKFAAVKNCWMTGMAL